MSVRTVQLEDVCDVTDGTHYTPPNSGGPFPFLTVKDMTEDGLAFKGCSYVAQVEFAKARSVGACPSAGDVLFSKDGTVGKVHVVSSEKPFAVLSSIAILRPDRTRLDSGFLGYALRNPAILRDATNRKTGSALQRIILGDLKEVSIPLPDLSEQKRIARLLEQANRLRRTRRYALELSDTFLPAAFLKLFGDPLENPRGYKVEKLGDLFQISPGLGTTKPCEPGGNLRCVRVGEVGFGGIDLHACGFVNLSESERRKCMVQAGDILLARAIGSEDHLGKLSICQPHAGILAFDSHLMRVRVNLSRLLPQFLASLLWSSGGRRLFMRQARRTAVQFNINAEQMSELAIPLPPLDQQRNFAGLVARRERLLAGQHEALRQADHFFQSLLYQAFTATVSE